MKSPGRAVYTYFIKKRPNFAEQDERGLPNWSVQTRDEGAVEDGGTLNLSACTYEKRRGPRVHTGFGEVLGAQAEGIAGSGKNDGRGSAQPPDRAISGSRGGCGVLLLSSGGGWRRTQAGQR